MLLSCRLDKRLGQQVREVAAQKGVPVSAVVREALGRYCEAEGSNDTLARLADYIGAFESAGGQADRTGEAFTEALVERQRR